MSATSVSYSVAVTRIPTDATGVEVTTDTGIEIIFGTPTLNVVDRRLNTVSIRTAKGNVKVQGYKVRGLINPSRESRVTFSALTR